MLQKIFKIISITILILILCIVIDLFCIFTFNRPIFAIKRECNKCNDKYYLGIFYDTYYCVSNSSPTIKAKTSKYNCPSVNLDERFLITVDYSDKKDKINSHVINSQSENLYFIHYYGIESISIMIKGENYELIFAIENNLITINDIISELRLIGIYKEGGSKMFTSVPNGYNSDIYNYNILKCNKIYGTKDIYIGSSDMKYENGFCEYKEN